MKTNPKDAKGFKGIEAFREATSHAHPMKQKEALIRHVAQQRGMDEGELLSAVILDEADEAEIGEGEVPETTSSRNSRLETLARSLTVTVDDIGTMTLAAGVEAMEEALARSGKLELPLCFHIAPPGTRPVFIPEAVHQQLELAGRLVGLDHPADDIVAHIMAGTVDDAENLVQLASDIAPTIRKEGGEA